MKMKKKKEKQEMIKEREREREREREVDGPGDLGSILDRVIPKTLKMVLDTSLLNTQQYKVLIKGKVGQSWKKSSALPYTSG